jgi:hypothetical protein
MTNQRLDEISEELFFGRKMPGKVMGPRVMEEFSKFQEQLKYLLKLWTVDPDDTE